MKAKRADYYADDGDRGEAEPAIAAQSRDERQYAFVPSAAQGEATLQARYTPEQHAPANEALAFGCLAVGRDVNVAGSLTVPGTLHVEGRIDGNVEAREVIVMRGGMLVGEVSCAQALVSGTLKGEIHCTERLTILADAQVEGEIHYYKDIRVETGSRLNCTISFKDTPAPVHNIVSTLDRIAPPSSAADSAASFLATHERELARDAVPLPASLMTRLFGSGKSHSSRGE